MIFRFLRYRVISEDEKKVNKTLKCNNKLNRSFII